MKKIFSFLLFCLGMEATVLAQTSKIEYFRPFTETELADGVHYIIRFDSLFIDSHARPNTSPLSVRANSVGIIELRKGQKLIVKGSDGTPDAYQRDQYPGYPGILVPESATLVVYGDGEIIAEGGHAGTGAIGENGGNGYISSTNVTFATGGAGGDGGGGGAPGIGAMGGSGGKGVVTPQVADKGIDVSNDYKEKGVAGTKGGDGHNGNSMGKVYILGNIKVTALAGKQQSFVSANAVHGSGLNYYQGSGFFLTSLSRRFFRVGYGGGGGNGGGGVAAHYDIGGGAPGAGAGGSGGGGGFMSDLDRDDLYFITGQGGRGGNSLVDSISGRHGEGRLYDDGAAGGASGEPSKVFGGNGNLYITPNVILHGSYESGTLATISDLTMVPEKARQLIERPLVGATWSNGEPQLKTFVGQEMPTTAVEVLSDATKGNFLGYYDQYGKKVYDAEGNLALDKDNHSYNFDVKTIEDADHWFVNSMDTIQLSAVWSGVKTVFVVRYLENPNFGGYQNSKERFTSGTLVTEQIYVPATERTVKVALYPEEISQQLYVYHEPTDQDFVTIKLDDKNETTTVEMFYDRATYQLSWEGLSDEILSRRCTNLNEYTRAGSYPFGKEIIFPELKQVEGSEFSHWEYKTSSQEYATFDGRELPAENLILKPVFATAVFRTTILQEGTGSVKLALADGKEVTDDTAIGYHEQVTIVTACETDYRCKQLHVVGAETQREIDLTENDGKTTFLMPDENVIISAGFEYHPFFTLNTIVNDKNVKYYVTKDWKTYYTDDNDSYYHFTSEQSAGKVSDMKYASGERFYIHTDLVGDNGSREPKIYIEKSVNKADLIEILPKSTGYGDSLQTFFAIEVDDILAEKDLPLHITWTPSRENFAIQIYDNDASQVVEMYSGKLDMSVNEYAYPNDLITFKVESTDPDFDASNILAEYKDGRKTLYQDVVKSEDGQFYAFHMPESDVDLMLLEGTKYSILTDCENDSVIILAPARAIEGYPVNISLYFLSENVSQEEAKQYIVYVNGMSAADIDGFNKTFVLPSENAILTIHHIGEIPANPDGISQINSDDMRKSPEVYNLMGQKVGQLNKENLNKLPAGVLIINGRKLQVK